MYTDPVYVSALHPPTVILLCAASFCSLSLSHPALSLSFSLPVVAARALVEGASTVGLGAPTSSGLSVAAAVVAAAAPPPPPPKKLFMLGCFVEAGRFAAPAGSLNWPTFCGPPRCAPKMPPGRALLEPGVLVLIV